MIKTTMALETGRQRDWCFTINNYSDEDICSIACMSTDAKYLVCGFEVGDKGVPHMQGYVYFDRKMSLKQLRNYNSRAHYERRRSPKIADASDYCKKDGEFVEFGILPSHGGEKVTFELIKEAMESPEQHPVIAQRYKKVYDYAQQLNILRSEIKTDFYVIDNVGDYIGEIINYLDWEEEDCKSLAVVTDLVELEAYRHKSIDKIIFIPEIYELKHILWARGMPISYKFGYEVKAVKPRTFVIATAQPELYKRYNLIKY